MVKLIDEDQTRGNYFIVKTKIKRNSLDETSKNMLSRYWYFVLFYGSISDQKEEEKEKEEDKAKKKTK